MAHTKRSSADTKSQPRPTIGVLVSHITHKNDSAMWQGVVDAARQQNVDVICFVGLWLDSPYGFEAQANVIYDLVSTEKLDGLVIMAGPITQFVQPEKKRAFIDRYHPLPIVILDSEMDGTPSIYVDSLQNMRKVARHLIEAHNYRRIAFIRGPETHQGANGRYQAYIDTLAEHDLPFDAALVTPPLNWYDGRKGLAWLLEQQVDFEAVIGANDDLAIGAMEELRTRGLRIPDDVAVAGYDDAAQSRWMNPPLTTVPIETYKWGQQALEMVLALIEGQQVPEQVAIPTDLIVRQSCGCIDPTISQTIVEPDLAIPQDTKNQSLANQKEAILAAVQHRAQKENLSLETGQITQLLTGFLTELDSSANDVFLRTLNQIFHHTVETGGDIEEWHQVVSALRRQTLAYLSDHETRLHAENLWQQARLMIGQTAYHIQGYQGVRAEQRQDILREIGSELITTFDVEGLMDVLTRQLPRLNIPNAYVALYEDPQKPSGLARLLLAYKQQERVKIDPEECLFPAPQLIPQKLWPRDQHYSMVALPLYFQTEQIGFVMFEANPKDGPMYEALREQISSALQGALLVQRGQENAAEIARQKYVLDTFMETVPDLIYFKDRDSRLTQVNSAFADRLGVEQSTDLVGKSDFDFFAEETARLKYEQEQEIIRTGRPLLDLEEPDTEGRWALTTKMPLRDENDNIIGTFGISRDITELKRAQQAVELAYARVEQEVKERTAELQREVAEREHLQQEIIETQQRAIKELSTPVIPVWDRVIIVPLIGSIDSLRARDITRALLAGISQHRARVVIIDVTGVPVVDSGVAGHLHKTVQAARLKGTRTIVTGITAAVAETIVDLGIDWSHFEAMSDLQTGLRAALTGLKYKV